MFSYMPVLVFVVIEIYLLSMFSFVVELIVIYPVPVSRALISSLQSFSRFSS